LLHTVGGKQNGVWRIIYPRNIALPEILSRLQLQGCLIFEFKAMQWFWSDPHSLVPDMKNSSTLYIPLQWGFAIDI
jgi:hypothetical protein